MSKICEKCGNMIPDGVDVCPNCGREDDAAIEAVMNDLSKAFADLGTPETAAPKSVEPEHGTVEDDTILFRPEEIKKAEQQEAKQDYDLSSAIEAAMKQASDTAADEPLTQDPPKAEEPLADKPEPDDMASVADVLKNAKEPAKNATAKKPKSGASKGTKTQSKGTKPKRQEADGANKKKKPPEDAKTPKKSGSHASSSKKKKKKKKDSSKALLGIVIGLIVVLLIVVGAAFGMLYKLGFFETMTDDELLGTSTPAVTQDATPTPEVTPDAIAPEASTAEEETVFPGGSAADENTPVEAGGDIEVTKFKVTGAEYITLYSRGETTEVVYVIDPSDAKNSIQWESSDETIATVNDYGVISARRGGTCTVTGTCGDASITVYVTCDFTVPSTVLDMNYEDVTMNHEGQTLALAIDYDLTSEQIKNTVWESSDETVATVDDEGNVTAVADGTAVITASIAEYTASCIVRCVNVSGNKGVNSSESEYVINYEDVTLSRKGEYFQLTLKSVVGNDVPDFTWKSSDTKVATVDSKGVVTAVANGTCKITTSVGADDFECVVRVNISG